jgi:hypothetical protein
MSEIEPIKPINLIDPAILAEIAKDYQINLLPQEQALLEKSKEIGYDMVEAANLRQKQWRANIQRTHKRQEDLARVKDSIRTDQGLAARTVDEFRTKKAQDKTIEERREIREKIEANEQKKILEEERQQAQIDKRRNEKAQRADIQAERALKRKEAEPTPEAFRERIEKRLDEVTENAREKINDQREARDELVESTQAERRNEMFAAKERLREKMEAIDEIERIQHERTVAKNELVKSAEAWRETRRENFAKIREIRDEKYEEKMQPTLEHFKKLEQRMITILEASSTHRIESRAIIKELVTRARERSSNALLASGNPLAQAEALPNLEFFGLVRQRINTMLTQSDENRTESVTNKEEIVTNARERRDRNMFLSGNPIELYKVLGAIKFFDLRRNKELFEIIQRARERSDYNDAISGLPHEKRRELHRVLHRIMALLINPVIIKDTFDQNILAIARKNPNLISRRLVEKILEHIFSIKNSFSFIRDVEHSINRSRRPSIEDNNHEYNPVVQKAAKQSLLKTIPIDTFSASNLIFKTHYPNAPSSLLRYQKTLLMIDYLIATIPLTTEREDTSPALNRPYAEVDPDKINITLERTNLRSVLSSFVPNKATAAEKIIQENFADNNTIDPIASAYILSILPSNVFPERQNTLRFEDIYTVIEAPIAYFDSLGKEIRENIGEDIFPKEKMLQGVSPEEEHTEELRKDKERFEKNDDKARINALETRKQYLMKLIEDQNKTDHEKVNDETNLLDLFF